MAATGIPLRAQVNEPVAGVVIALLDTAGRPVYETVTSARGAFIVRHVAPGTYRLLVRAPVDVRLVPSSGGSSPNPNARVTVPALPQDTVVRFSFTNAGRVASRATHEMSPTELRRGVALAAAVGRAKGRRLAVRGSSPSHSGPVVGRVSWSVAPRPVAGGPHVPRRTMPQLDTGAVVRMW
jgi:hypothetical protein